MANLVSTSLQASATQVQPSILALESLQDCINELQRGITAKIVELKRYKNQNEVLLHTLPPEIFLEILSASIDWPNWNVERNHTLGQVCKVRNSLVFPQSIVCADCMSDLALVANDHDSVVVLAGDRRRTWERNDRNDFTKEPGRTSGGSLRS